MSATATSDRERVDQALEDLSGQGRMPTPQQLSFNTGQRGEPDYASVKISGSLPVDRDLLKGQGFYVRVVTLGGEFITEGMFACTNLAFPDKTDKDGVTTTERVHTLSVDKAD